MRRIVWLLVVVAICGLANAKIVDEHAQADSRTKASRDTKIKSTRAGIPISSSTIPFALSVASGSKNTNFQLNLFYEKLHGKRIFGHGRVSSPSKIFGAGMGRSKAVAELALSTKSPIVSKPKKQKDSKKSKKVMENILTIDHLGGGKLQLTLYGTFTERLGPGKGGAFKKKVIRIQIGSKDYPARLDFRSQRILTKHVLITPLNEDGSEPKATATIVFPPDKKKKTNASEKK